MKHDIILDLITPASLQICYTVILQWADHWRDHFQIELIYNFILF